MVCSLKSLALLALAVVSVATPASAQLDPVSVSFAANAAVPSTSDQDPVERPSEQASPPEAGQGVISDSVSNVVTETKVDAPDVEPETPEIEAGWRPVGEADAPAASTPVDEPTPSPDESATPAPAPESSASGAVTPATALVVMAAVAITGFFI